MWHRVLLGAYSWSQTQDPPASASHVLSESWKSSVPLGYHFVYNILLWFYIAKPLPDHTFTSCSLCALENMSLYWKSPKGTSQGCVQWLCCRGDVVSTWQALPVPEVKHTHSLSSDHHLVCCGDGHCHLVPWKMEGFTCFLCFNQ